MALTAYCKKCAREVDAGEICPFCGSRLGKNAAHAAWCVERTPVKDWMCWNALMRVLLPAALFILLLVLAAEGISGGVAAVEKMLVSGFPAVLLSLLGAIVLLVFAALLLQGKELADFVVDNRGIHEIHYLPNPTSIKLMARLRSPAQMRNAAQGSSGPMLKLSEKNLAWKDVARVQLWPEKCMILYYAPAWWLRIAAACTPFVWDDVMGITREKLGKKRKVKLPSSLVIPAEQRSQRTVSRPKYTPDPGPEDSPGQLSMDTLFDAPPVDDTEQM